MIADRTARRRFAAALLAGVVGVCAAHAEPARQRTAAQQRLVIRLAHVLGEAHALHRLCAGPEDATWYSRMLKLEAEEAPDIGFRQQLVQSFNAGFSERQEQFDACSPAVKAAERAAARRGRRLAQQLAAAR